LFRWKDKTLFNFFQSSAAHKIKTISWLITTFPQRQFILVGDSGEQDPEIYAQLAQQYPQQIAYILIREVTQESNERYQTLFQSLPQLRWQIFQDAATVKLKLTDLNSSPR
jgi:phosphatidate phosphatase APP1